MLLIGCGDLPKRLVAKLNTNIWQVTGLCRSKVEIDDVQMHYGDANDAKLIEKLLNPPPDQLIITLTPDTRTPEAYRQTYLGPAQLIAESVRELAPSCHLIFISSTSVYGQNDGESVDEYSKTEPKEETAQILIQAERAIIYSGNPWSIVRFSGIYGPGKRATDKKNYARRFY